MEDIDKLLETLKSIEFKCNDTLNLLKIKNVIRSNFKVNTSHYKQFLFLLKNYEIQINYHISSTTFYLYEIGEMSNYGIRCKEIFHHTTYYNKGIENYNNDIQTIIIPLLYKNLSKEFRKIKIKNILK